MLSKKRRIKKKKEFENVFKKGKSFSGSFLIIKTINNNLSFSRFAFVSPLKSFKKATERNRIKRVMRAVIESSDGLIENGFDIMIIARKQTKDKNYEEVKDELVAVLKKAKLTKTEQ